MAMEYVPSDWSDVAARLNHLETGLKDLYDAFAAHEAATNPHPIYLTEAEADAKYTPPPSAPVAPPAVTAPASYGVPAGTVLTTLTTTNNPNPANTFISSGAVYKIVSSGTFNKVRFAHRVEVHAGDVRFVDCYFAGAAQSTTAAVALLTIAPTGTGTVTAERCTFIPDKPYDGIDAVRGGRLTLDRCNIANTVDGIGLYDIGSATVRNSWLHDFIYYANNSHPTASDTGTHNDCVQISNGSSFLFEGNLFSGTAKNAGFMITQGRGPVTNLAIKGNTFDITDNSADINLYDGGTAVLNLTITGNTFKKDLAKYQMLISPKTKAAPSTAISGNVWHDGSVPPPAVKTGG